MEDTGTTCSNARFAGLSRAARALALSVAATVFILIEASLEPMPAMAIVCAAPR